MKLWRIAGILSLVLLSGCLERKEKVTVHEDGTVAVSCSFKGDPGEFTRPGLSIGAPWKVKDEDAERGDGKVKDHLRTAEATFRRAEDIPASFGASDDPAPLHARSTLAIEHVDGGRVRYTFERRYESRAFAWKQRIFERNVPEELLKSLERHEGDPPLPEERLRAATTAILGFEREKQEVFLDDALSAVTSADAAAHLAARAAFDRAFDETWKVDDLVHWLDLSPEESAKLDRRFHDETEAAARKAAVLAILGPEPAADEKAALEAKVGKEFATRRRTLEETDALQGHSFEIRVEMPAKITMSDAGEVEGDGKVAVWKFGGKDLCDRELVLRVVAESTGSK